MKRFFIQIFGRHTHKKSSSCRLVDRVTNWVGSVLSGAGSTLSTAPAPEFLNPLILQQINAKHWWDFRERHEVFSNFVFRDRHGAEWRVEKRFDTDLASVPRACLFLVILALVGFLGMSFPSWLWLLLMALMVAFPCSGIHNQAAVLHDFLYWAYVRKGTMERLKADWIFFQALRACKVDIVRSVIMAGAVAIFGGLHMGLSNLYYLLKDQALWAWEDGDYHDQIPTHDEPEI